MPARLLRQLSPKSICSHLSQSSHTQFQLAALKKKKKKSVALRITEKQLFCLFCFFVLFPLGQEAVLQAITLAIVCPGPQGLPAWHSLDFSMGYRASLVRPWGMGVVAPALWSNSSLGNTALSGHTQNYLES